MASDQRMARINIDEDTWIRLRVQAVLANRSLADYLGDLVREEVAAHEAGAGTPRVTLPARPHHVGAAPARDGAADSQWNPPWEE